MSELHSIYDDHLLHALAGELNAAMYEALVHEDVESIELDDADRLTTLGTTAERLPESTEPNPPTTA